MMKQYLDHMRNIISNGVKKKDRTGVGTVSVFGSQMRFNLQEGFPLLTTKKIYFEAVVYELLWFIRGGTNIKYLNDHNVHIWDEWADDNGDLGPIYGKQWRSWPSLDGRSIDQLKEVLNSIKYNPDSRRHIVSAWNVSELSDMAIPPCHTLFQFYVSNDKLSCLLYQRSADWFLGVPFNIASYSLLTHMVAKQCGLKVGEFIWTGGDCHLYLNHLDLARKQLEREPGELPLLLLSDEPQCIDDYDRHNILLLKYKPQSSIKAPIAV